MNGQFLLNKPITVQYAYKKDGKGERHGSAEGTRGEDVGRWTLGVGPGNAGPHQATLSIH